MVDNLLDAELEADVTKPLNFNAQLLVRQLVKVVVEIGDEKEIQEFPVAELKFRSRKKKVKVSEQEMKELQDLEDKKGDSKLND